MSRPVTRAAIEVSIYQSKGGKGAHTAPTSDDNGQPPNKNEQPKQRNQTYALAMTNSETVTTSHTSNTAAVIH